MRYETPKVDENLLVAPIQGPSKDAPEPRAPKGNLPGLLDWLWPPGAASSGHPRDSSPAPRVARIRLLKMRRCAKHMDGCRENIGTSRRLVSVWMSLPDLLFEGHQKQRSPLDTVRPGLPRPPRWCHRRPGPRAPDCHCHPRTSHGTACTTRCQDVPSEPWGPLWTMQRQFAGFMHKRRTCTNCRAAALHLCTSL